MKNIYELDGSEQIGNNKFERKQANIKSIIIINVLALIFLIVLGFGIYSAIAANNNSKVASQYKTLYEKTAEGKNSVEQANTTLTNQNASLDAKATNAENQATDAQKQAADAKTQTNQTQAQLNTKLSELSKASADLASKQSDLAKAQRGIDKFNQLKNLYDTLNKDNAIFMTALSDGYGALLSGDTAKVEKCDNDINKYTGMCNKDLDAIDALNNEIKTGNY